MTALRWIADRLKDLFYASGNNHLELNRVSVGFAGALVLVSLIFDIIKGEPIDLGPGGLCGGLAALITASGLAISAKDWSSAQIIKAKDSRNA